MFTKPWRSFRSTIILGVSNITRPLRLEIVSLYSMWHWNQVKYLSFTSQKSPCLPKISTLWPRCSGVVVPTRAWIPCCFRKTTMSSWVAPHTARCVCNDRDKLEEIWKKKWRIKKTQNIINETEWTGFGRFWDNESFNHSRSPKFIHLWTYDLFRGISAFHTNVPGGSF